MANLQEFHFSTGVEDVPQGAQFQFASPYPNCKEAAYEHWIVREIVDGGLASKYAYFYLPTL